MSKLNWDHTVTDGVTEDQSVGKSGKIGTCL